MSSEGAHQIFGFPVCCSCASPWKIVVHATCVLLYVMIWIRWLWNEYAHLWEDRTYQSLVKMLSMFSLSCMPDLESLHFAWKLADNWNWSHRSTKILIIFTGILKSVILGVRNLKFLYQIKSKAIWFLLFTGQCLISHIKIHKVTYLDLSLT